MIWTRPPQPKLIEAEPWAEEFLMSRASAIEAARFNMERLRTGFFYRLVPDGLAVVYSGRTERDGRRWVHVSGSHKNRTPTWEKMKEMHAVFIGEERRAIQVFVPKSEWVNDHPYALHLWHCLDGDGLPDFRHEIDGALSI